MTIKTIIDADGSVITTDDGSEGGVPTTTIIRADGTTTTTSEGGAVPASSAAPGTMMPGRDREDFDDDHTVFDPGSFVAGLFLATLIAICLSVWRSSRAGKATPRTEMRSEPDRMATDVAALARRTAALETIVTDPGHRTAREIDALR